MVKKILKAWKARKKRQFSATQLIAIAFAAIIAVGTCLLALPVASRSGESCGFLTALFTATSATCVTGLTLVDTWTQWSGFGQIVLLILFELGGLGFMSMAAMVIFLLRQKVGLKQRMVMAQALSMSDMGGIVKLQKIVLIGSILIQLAGALILMVRFWPEHGLWQAVKWGIFHSVAAYCNSGFDIFGSLQPGSSLSLFYNDPVVLLTVSALVILGGLGFFVWQEIFELRRWKKFSVYTKLVLMATAVLLAGGMFLICLLEWNNPATLGAMTVPEKLLGGFFQSVTTRTAGFFAMDQGAMTDGGKMVSIVLMLVGGSSGSTAGGIKTVTFLVLLMFIWSRIRSRSTVTAFKRTIPGQQVLDAVTVICIVVGLALTGAVFICSTCGVGFLDALYETASAIATVGLTTGVTGELTVVGQILIIIYMYFGRVGVLTLSLGFLMGDRAVERFRYADTNLLIG